MSPTGSDSGSTNGRQKNTALPASDIGREPQKDASAALAAAERVARAPREQHEGVNYEHLQEILARHTCSHQEIYRRPAEAPLAYSPSQVRDFLHAQRQEQLQVQTNYERLDDFFADSPCAETKLYRAQAEAQMGYCRRQVRPALYAQSEDQGQEGGNLGPGLSWLRQPHRDDLAAAF